MRSFGIAPVVAVSLLSVHMASANESRRVDDFHFTLQAELPGSADFAYGLITGDISAWWDHTFTQKPLKLYVDARPGGGFYEIFDEAGNGVEHARVIFAKSGEKLTLVGPLGFNGWATDIVFTYQFEETGTGTLLRLTVNGSGQMEDGWADSVEAVWRHFIFERLVPYAERRCEEVGCR